MWIWWKTRWSQLPTISGSMGLCGMRSASDILNRVRLLKAVQYLSLMNLIKPTAVYILDHHWPEICIAGYQLLRRDRCGKAGGGVAIYVKDDLNCVRFIKYDVLILKLSGLKYVHSPSDCLLVVCTDLLTVLISLINFAVLWKKKWLTEKNVVIAGDGRSTRIAESLNHQSSHSAMVYRLK